MSALILVLNLATLVFVALSVLFQLATRYYTRQTSRILRYLPEQPKPWYVRLVDPLIGGRRR